MNGIDDQSRPALARGVRLQMDATTGQPVLLFPEGALYLSSTAHEIVSRCDGTTTAAAILAALATDYEADVDTLRRDVWDCLQDLRERKVLVLAK